MSAPRKPTNTAKVPDVPADTPPDSGFEELREEFTATIVGLREEFLSKVDETREYFQEVLAPMLVRLVEEEGKDSSGSHPIPDGESDEARAASEGIDVNLYREMKTRGLR